MDRRKMEKFRVVGANVKSQTISLEEEMVLFDGIPYMIEPSRDFTNVYLGRCPIKDIPINDIMKYIDSLMRVRTCRHYNHTLMGERHWDGVRIGEEFEKIRRCRKKKQKKLEKKFWKEYWYLFG